MTQQNMDWKGYIAHQVKTGVYSEDSPFPENDPRTLAEYFALLRAETGKEEDARIAVLANRYGYFFDPADEGRDGANVVGSTSLIDVNIGIPYAEFVNDLPAIRADAELSVVTDTFCFSDGYGDGSESHDGLYWLNSPVASLARPFEPYLESLTTERRKKYRRSVADFEKTNLKFEMSDRGFTPAEMEFVRSNLYRKWGDEAEYAYRQSLWAYAVQKVRPAQSLVMRVTDGGKLVFVQTMITKKNTVYCQTITKDEDSFYNGLAAFTDFECIKALCGKGSYAIFDPSCRCSFDDPESIGIAKRATVNMNCLKPLLVAGPLPAPTAAIIETGKIHGKEA